MATPLTRAEWLDECAKLAKTYEEAMTDEEKALIDAVDRYVRVCTTGSSDGSKYRARKNLMGHIETQAREIERLRDQLEYVVKELSSYRAKYMVGTSAPLGESHDQ